MGRLSFIKQAATKASRYLSKGAKATAETAAGAKTQITNVTEKVKGFGGYIKPKKGWRWLFGLIVILAIIGSIIVFAMYYSQTKTGQIAVTSLKQSFPGLSNALSSIAAPFNIIKEVFTGTYDPTNLWTAEQAESEYSDKQELKLVITDVHPAKNFFYPSEELQVDGRIDVSGGIRDGTPVTMSFGDSCPIATSCDDRKIDKWGWKCYISGSDQENSFEIKKAYNRIFYCNHEGVPANENLVYDTMLKWDYQTTAVAIKQIYVASEDVINREEDLVKYFNIDETTLEPWYLGEERVNIGMGLDQNVDFVQAYAGGKFMPVYLLGISIENKGSGNIISIDNLKLTFPQDSNIQIKETEQGIYNDFEHKEQYTKDSIKLVDYSLRVSKRSTISESNPIKPGEHRTFYIAFWVDQNYLRGSSYQSFISKTTSDYTYQESTKTSLTIKKAEEAPLL